MWGAIIGAAASLATSAIAANQQKKQAQRQEELISKQNALNDAWYRRSYYQDYLNTAQAQNAMKRYRKAWEDHVREARARQVISGGSPAQVAAAQEAGAEGYSNLVGNLAAQGEQNRQAIDAQKLAMDTGVNNSRQALAEKRQQAAATSLANGMNVLANSVQGYEPKEAPTEVPKLETPVIRAPETSTRVNAPSVVGKEAGINPDLIENPAEEVYQFYTKNPSVRY